MAACESYEDFAHATLGSDLQTEATCTLTGVTTELAGFGTCEDAVADCLESSGPEPEPLDLDCENVTSLAPAGCTATVGEIEACVNALGSAIDGLRSRLSCELADDPEAIAEITAEFQTVFSQSECESLEDECLDLLGLADIGSVVPGT
jgi:hypothetical protein